MGKLTASETKKLAAGGKTVTTLTAKLTKPDPAPKKPAPKTAVKKAGQAKVAKKK